MTLQLKLRLLYASEFFIFFHLISGVLIPFYMIWGGLSLTQLMILQGWFSLWIVLLEIPTGSLADSIGRKKTILLGIALNIIGVYLYTIEPNFWIFLLAEMFWAFSQAMFSGAKEALTYDLLLEHGKEKMAKSVFSKSKTAHLLALMISAPIGSILGAKLGFEWPMILMLIPMALSALTLSLIPEPKRYRSGASQVNLIRSGWKYFSSHPYLKIMAFDMVTIWSIAFMIVWFQQITLTSLGVSEKYFGWFVTAGLLFQIMCLWIYPLLDKYLHSKKLVFALTGACPGIGFLLMGLYPSVTTVLIGLFLCSGFGLTRRTIYISYLNKFIDSHHRATVNSFINMGASLVGVMIKPVFGYLGDINLSLALIGLGVTSLVVTIISQIEEKMFFD